MRTADLERRALALCVLAPGDRGYDAARRRVRRARALIAPFGNGGAYQNYADLGLRSPRRAYYGANLGRLRSIKAAVDPDGRFAPGPGHPLTAPG